MAEVRLNRIIVSGNTIEYEYSYSDDLSRFFSATPFVISYEKNIEKVPAGILAIPFLSSVLPIIWLTNSSLFVDELDEAFFNCIPEVKKGYEKMFPGVKFLGNLHVNSSVAYKKINVDGISAMFFSGGLDSYQTLISHIDEQPLLISIWGSDIKVDNSEGWDNLKKILTNAGEKYKLPVSVIKSSFREFDCEGELHKEFSGLLGDGWWHGVKHGIGLIGHVAPLAYLLGIDNMYIASTNWPEQGIQKCASSPWTDNFVRFCNTKVIHDGYEYSRQDKVHNIVNYAKKNNDRIDLHVCWQTQTGKNCCHCEKCYRTIAGILAEGADPKQFGFDYSEVDLVEMEKIIKSFPVKETISTYWPNIQASFRKNQKDIKKNKYYYWYQWIIDTNFDRPETMSMNWLRSLRMHATLLSYEVRRKNDILYPLRVLHGHIHDKLSK